MNSRVCKDLDREAGQGVLAESPEYHLAPVLARAFDDEPAHNDQYEADIRFCPLCHQETY